MASSLSQIHVLCSSLTMSSFPLEIEKNIQALKISRFYSTSHSEIEEILDGSLALALHKSPHFFGLPCILLWLGHTLSHVHIFFSDTKYCYSRNDVRSQLAPFSAIRRLWTWRRAILHTLDIHTKLTQIATTVIFSQLWSGKKGNLY